MRVLVIGLNGIGLMPTTPRKARKLLEAHKAEVFRKHPFTIRLKYKTGCATQRCQVGTDTGSQHIGMAIVSNGKVLDKSEHELRSTMEKRKLMETRKTYRRGRRYRNTPYRHPKFRHHTKRTYMKEPIKRNGHLTHWKKETISFTSSRPEGWLPPSVQSKAEHHIDIINAYKEALPPDTKFTIELARFDMQKIKDPDVHGEEYQYGRLYAYENIKAYVLARQDYTCPICRQRFGAVRKDGKSVKARMHHLHFRSEGASDNPDDYIAVCDYCHTPEAHQEGGELAKLRKKAINGRRGMRDMTMVNIVASKLRETFPFAKFTYGNITNADRKTLGLEKTHANDAVAIAKHRDIAELGDYTLYDTADTTLYKQVRKKKRSLHEANPRKGRKEPNREAKRNVKNAKERAGICLFDKIRYKEEVGVVTGFSKNQCRAVRNDGKYVGANEKYRSPMLSSKDIKVLHHNNNWTVRSTT